jgi:hypothetical protein
MNVGTLKTLSYLTSFGLLGGIGYIGYDYYENGKNVSYFDVARAGEVLNGVRPPAPPKRTALDYTSDITPAIVKFDWTGKPPEISKPDEGPGAEDLVAVTVRVAEVLEVRMVIADPENPGDSFCLVAFKDPAADPHEMLLEVGDTLPAPNESVSVLRILHPGAEFSEPGAELSEPGAEFSFSDDDREPEIVRLSNRVVDVIVSLDDPSQLKHRTLIGRTGGTPGASRTAPGETEVRNGQFFIGADDASLIRDNYGDIFSRDVKTETYYDKDGNRAGVKINEVRAGSVAERLGAQAGDVIIAINGTSVNSQQEAIQFAKDNSERYSVWEVQVMNLGRVRTEIYHSPSN